MFSWEEPIKSKHYLHQVFPALMKGESLSAPCSNFITTIPGLGSQCVSHSGGSCLESSQLVCQQIGSSCISMGVGMLLGWRDQF